MALEKKGTSSRALLALAAGLLLLTAVPAASDVNAGRPAPERTAVLVGAGDIGSCESDGDEATAALLDEIPGTVFTTGDNAYPQGREEDFAECYDPSWGAHTERTRPAAGNHEYDRAGAEGYFGYFGAAAGKSGEGWYSYDAATWHVVVLNSNCDQVGGCEPGSPQHRWLRADLAAHPGRCTLAYWHHPRFSGGPHGSHESVQPLWEALDEAGADLVLNGHDHDYQRFAPQTPSGEADADGIREIVVGTGGSGLYAVEEQPANLEAYSDDTYGVLKLTLRPGAYEWEFVPAGEGTFTDEGSAACV